MRPWRDENLPTWQRRVGTGLVLLVAVGWLGTLGIFLLVLARMVA